MHQNAANGPRMVFFTGGTALRALSTVLTRYTWNSLHLVTPFDSGGSTAALRKAFGMLAVGDVRNRLLALADRSCVSEALVNFCNERLPKDGDVVLLRQELCRRLAYHHSCWEFLPATAFRSFRSYFEAFIRDMPEDFDPRLASMGNLVLAGGFLSHGRSFRPVLEEMSALLHVRGQVLPVVEASMHLAAELADGSMLVGQHHFSRLEQPVRRLFLAPYMRYPGVRTSETKAHISGEVRERIAMADLICYPMGSFYTSVVANLLPQGISEAICQAQCPKIYISNSGHDSEQCGYSVAERVRIILDTLRKYSPDAPAQQLLHAVLVDRRNGSYPSGIREDAIRAQGVEVWDVPIVDTMNVQRHDPEMTARVLMDFCKL